MKLCTSLLIAIALFALPLFGQTSAPAAANPDTEANIGQHVSIDTSYLKCLTCGTGKETTATVVTGTVPFTPRWSIGGSVLSFGPDAKWYFAGGRLTEKLGHIIHPKNVLINLNLIQFSLDLGVGIKRDSLKKTNFAYGVGGAFTIPMGKVAGGTVRIGARGGIIGAPGDSGPKHFGLGSVVQPLASITF